jgi:hypothetical protein
MHEPHKNIGAAPAPDGPGCRSGTAATVDQALMLSILKVVYACRCPRVRR